MDQNNEYAHAVARERARAMLRLLERGETLASVAEIYGISRQRVHQLIAKHFPGSGTRRRRRKAAA